LIYYHCRHGKLFIEVIEMLVENIEQPQVDLSVPFKAGILQQRGYAVLSSLPTIEHRPEVSFYQQISGSQEAELK
jgi:hypothetical protein